MPDEKKPEQKAAPAPSEQDVAVSPKMLNKPYVAPDGHVVLSQEDIDNRG